MDFFKREMIVKKSVGGKVIESVVFAVIITIILYLCFNSSFVQNMFDAIKSGESSAFTISIILFPIILVISITINLGIFVLKLDHK